MFGKYADLPWELRFLVRDELGESERLALSFVDHWHYENFQPDLTFISKKYMLELAMEGRLEFLRWLFDSFGYIEDPQLCVNPLLCCAVEHNHLQLADYLYFRFQDYGLNLSKLAYYCGRSGHMAVLDHFEEDLHLDFSEQGIIDLFLGACSNGHLALVNEILERTDPYVLIPHFRIVEGLGEAAKGGHVDMVKFFFETKRYVVSLEANDAPTIDRLVDAFSASKKEEMQLLALTLFTKFSLTTFRTGIARATSLSVAEAWYHHTQAQYYNPHHLIEQLGLLGAVKNGSMEIFKFFFDNEAHPIDVVDMDDFMQTLASSNSVDLVRHCLDVLNLSPPANFLLLVFVFTTNDISLFKYLVERGFRWSQQEVLETGYFWRVSSEAMADYLSTLLSVFNVDVLKRFLTDYAVSNGDFSRMKKLVADGKCDENQVNLDTLVSFGDIRLIKYLGLAELDPKLQDHVANAICTGFFVTAKLLINIGRRVGFDFQQNSKAIVHRVFCAEHLGPKHVRFLCSNGFEISPNEFLMMINRAKKEPEIAFEIIESMVDSGVTLHQDTLGTFTVAEMRKLLRQHPVNPSLLRKLNSLFK